MHLAETEAEDGWAARAGHASPVAAAEAAGLLSSALLAAHLVRAGEGDVALLAARGVRAAHCPRANAKAGRPAAPVAALRRAGVAVGLATDGPMSSNTLDLFGQMAPAAMLARMRDGTRGALSARDVVAMATIDGARALGLDREVGSLEVGKRADLIRVSLEEPRVQPVHDLHAALAFAAGAVGRAGDDGGGALADARRRGRDGRGPARAGRRAAGGGVPGRAGGGDGMTARCVIDTDPGIDDAIAILFALRDPGLDVAALTSVGGNIGLEATTRNAGRVAALAGAAVPVHPGAAGDGRGTRAPSTARTGWAAWPSPRRRPRPARTR